MGVSAHVEDEGLLQRRHHHRDQLEAAVRRLRSRSAEVSALHVNEDDSAEVPEVGGAAWRRRIEDLVHSVTETFTFVTRSSSAAMESSTHLSEQHARQRHTLDRTEAGGGRRWAAVAVQVVAR